MTPRMTTTHDIPTAFDPKSYEEKWLKAWLDAEAFKADPKAAGKPFSIVIPPPNVTGALHMGHALNNTVMDVLSRYHRMRGRNVLWLPGTDHAGIATQSVVERELAKEKKTRHDLGREQFVGRVWKWKEEYGSRIIHQLKRLGSSCDWSRERFTMDEGLSLAVREVFVRLYRENLIYKGEYLVNWCPASRSAISDLEVEYREENGSLWHIRYPFSDGSGHLTVATTRPETMLGDTAVAVNPGDERYTSAIGKKLKLPLMDREIPVIGDAMVDREFGSGAVKITPAHDPNDYRAGQRHKLEMINVMNPDGTINGNGGPYQGMDRYAARKQIVADLEAQGLLEKVEKHKNRVGYSQRHGVPVEPLISEQWFVRTGPLAERALKAVKDGRTTFHPASWANTYYSWMERIEDWCISRQLWWGHQIPAWHCGDCGHINVELAAPKKCHKCGSGNLKQDEDVLDTWFSSALWPFSTMGWPGKTPELATYYPTSVLVTAHDIIFFWVARMMMMGLHFMDEVPFRDVYIHALVRDASGQKMSKTKGNVIDPLSVVDEVGADSVRFTLAAFAAQGRDIRLSRERIEGYRKFITKLWNAARFVQMKLGGPVPEPVPEPKLSPEDKWLRREFALAAKEVSRAVEAYEFDKAALAAYHFVWGTYCDWYIEFVKQDLGENADPVRREVAKSVLGNTLLDILKLLHPFIPFVTEELAALLKPGGAFLMKSSFPSTDVPPESEDIRRVARLQLAVQAARNIRGELNVKPSSEVNVLVRGEEAKDLLGPFRGQFAALARVRELSELPPGAPRPKGTAQAAVGGLEIFVGLTEGIDVEKERERLIKQIAGREDELSKLNQKLSNQGFVANADPDLVDEYKDRQADLGSEIEKLKGSLARLDEFTA